MHNTLRHTQSRRGAEHGDQKKTVDTWARIPAWAIAAQRYWKYTLRLALPLAAQASPRAKQSARAHPQKNYVFSSQILLVIASNFCNVSMAMYVITAAPSTHKAKDPLQSIVIPTFNKQH